MNNMPCLQLWRTHQRVIHKQEVRDGCVLLRVDILVRAGEYQRMRSLVHVGPGGNTFRVALVKRPGALGNVVYLSHVVPRLFEGISRPSTALADAPDDEQRSNGLNSILVTMLCIEGDQ